MCCGCCVSQLWESPISSSTHRTWGLPKTESSSHLLPPKKSTWGEGSWLMFAWTLPFAMGTQLAWMCSGLGLQWSPCQVTQQGTYMEYMGWNIRNVLVTANTSNLAFCKGRKQLLECDNLLDKLIPGWFCWFWFAFYFLFFRRDSCLTSCCLTAHLPGLSWAHCKKQTGVWGYCCETGNWPGIVSKLGLSNVGTSRM